MQRAAFRRRGASRPRDRRERAPAPAVGVVGARHSRRSARRRRRAPRRPPRSRCCSRLGTLGRCLERALVQLGRDDVREAGLRPSAGRDGVAPGRGRSPLPRGSGARAGRLPRRRGRPARSSSAAPTRPWISRPPPNERPSYAVARTRSWRNARRSLAAVDEELAERRPALERARDAGSRRRGLRRAAAGRTTARRPPRSAAASGRPGRACRSGPSAAVSTVSGSSFERLAVPGGPDELADEERIAARALDERRDRVARTERGSSATSRASVGGGSLPSGSSSSRRTWSPVRAIGSARRTRRHADEPRARSQAPRRGAQQEPRGVVEPVSVLDDDQRRHHQDAARGTSRRPGAAGRGSCRRRARSTSAVAGTSASNGTASSGSHGARSGMHR